ncbi:intraflagellar transport protein 74-like protein [Anopheles sinensis]|uniref:Intraflagellar transport protein 74-like protein n=1 Tax=Anopheles sinensis TaxID=74873 RepID=A0A084W4W5_ANOSI|nr:intraflagellar transport protein 74-like protein [Anopheles sinensis]
MRAAGKTGKQYTRPVPSRILCTMNFAQLMSTGALRPASCAHLHLCATANEVLLLPSERVPLPKVSSASSFGGGAYLGPVERGVRVFFDVGPVQCRHGVAGIRPCRGLVRQLPMSRRAMDGL